LLSFNAVAIITLLPALVALSGLSLAGGSPRDYYPLLAAGQLALGPGELALPWPQLKRSGLLHIILLAFGRPGRQGQPRRKSLQQATCNVGTEDGSTVFTVSILPVF